ncbi:MAG: VirB4 family type IV secretion/conjugal transfer ATPase, partial [Lysobacteraceae bacterium]
MFTPDTPISDFIPLSTHVSPSVLKTTGGDYLLVWHLGGLPFVGRDEWEIEHRHNTFNRMLQTLRAPDFANLAFWVHDVRRKRRISNRSKYGQTFNQELSDAYFDSLSSQKIMQNELYLTMIYRPVTTGKRLVEKSASIPQLQSEQDQAVAKIQELAGNLEAVLKDYSPYRLGMYEASNGVVFSEALEFFGYLLNRIDEPVPVLSAPVNSYLPVSRHMFSDKTGDFIINTP